MGSSLEVIWLLNMRLLNTCSRQFTYILMPKCFSFSFGFDSKLSSVSHGKCVFSIDGMPLPENSIEFIENKINLKAEIQHEN